MACTGPAGGSLAHSLIVLARSDQTDLRFFKMASGSNTSELARSLTEAIGKAITQTLGETEASTPFSEIISLNLPFLLANLLFILFIFVEWHFNIRYVMLT